MYNNNQILENRIEHIFFFKSVKKILESKANQSKMSRVIRC